MDQQRLFYLVDRLNEGKATDEELAEYNSYMNGRIAHEGDWDARLGNEAQARQQLFTRIEAGMPVVRVRRLWPRIAAAASILVACSLGAWFAWHHKATEQKQVAMVKHDIAPGHNQATLTLANGKKIILTKGLNGLLATQGKTAINASGNNIVYDASKTDQLVSYNTLSTARGEQSPYPLVLPDGSKVWLNAESSITFPTAFTGSERIVKVTGEAYFEIAHNSRQPFKVETNGQVTEDIGTSFDINSYTNEPAQRTTLVEGAIKVNGKLLKPGQQSSLVNRSLDVQDANLRQVLAWKNGEFRFDGQQIGDIMRQLERWYNIDVQYEGDISKEEFLGKISRYKNISQVLHMLSYNGAVHFKVEGRRVTVIR